MNGFIGIRGAKVHNLKDIDVRIPRGKFVVFTGVSGSGKSSLAFDTIYAEGQRRYLESLSSYARQFLGQFDKPDVEHISGLSPSIAIEQKSASHNPRSTVGTVTEIYDYLRVLFARIGHQHCYKCGEPVSEQSIDQMVDQVMKLPQGTRIYILAPVIAGRKGEYNELLEEARRDGFARVRIDGNVYSLLENIRLAKTKKHDIEIVVDRLKTDDGVESRLTESIETALRRADGQFILHRLDTGEDIRFSEQRACIPCGISYPELTPQHFSFNSPYGMCTECDGLGVQLKVDEALLVPDDGLSIERGAIKLWGDSAGFSSGWRRFLDAFLIEYGGSIYTPWRDLSDAAKKALMRGGSFKWRGKRRRFEGFANQVERLSRQTQSEGMRHYYFGFMSKKPCPACGGKKLRPESLAVKVGGETIDAIVQCDISSAIKFLRGMKLSRREEEIAHELLKEICERLSFLENVGLHYLTLDRSAPTLSGGESQRIRLASQIGSGLVGVLYILDEPSIGLHQRDNGRLIDSLVGLRDLGNTVIVVEHDEKTMRSADVIFDFGPGAGVHGGRIVATGSASELEKIKNSLTGLYLAGELEIPMPETRRESNGNSIEIIGASANNLKNIDVTIPLGVFVAVTGVSGSGKSSLINETLYKATASLVQGMPRRTGKFERMAGIGENIDKVIQISQKPIGRTPRSNAATYTKIWGEVRKLFSELPESRMRGYLPGRFSFNVKGGRCEACNGDGVKRIEMHFLADVFVTCDVCKGARFNRETLTVRYKGKNISDVLNMTVSEAIAHFENIPPILRGLVLLREVGLDYIQLGQSAPTLSGGESQRVKLARELSKRATGRTLYLLDEPTTGLHFDDIKKLLRVLGRLVDSGNMVVVIEHNLDVIKCADWIIDLGPEGGDGGGFVVAAGTPEEVATVKESFTGKYLRPVLKKHGRKLGRAVKNGTAVRRATAMNGG
ncbi:excinuclease ABC subunit UvrA [bacterium]|nr:excinuclease ABC subunit UvrA [bacterium]